MLESSVTFAPQLRGAVHPEGSVEVTGEFMPFGTSGPDDPSRDVPDDNGPGGKPDRNGGAS